jgi:hypothetical protein
MIESHLATRPNRANVMLRLPRSGSGQIEGHGAITPSMATSAASLVVGEQRQCVGLLVPRLRQRLSLVNIEGPRPRGYSRRGSVISAIGPEWNGEQSSGTLGTCPGRCDDGKMAVLLAGGDLNWSSAWVFLGVGIPSGKRSDTFGAGFLPRIYSSGCRG